MSCQGQWYMYCPHYWKTRWAWLFGQGNLALFGQEFRRNSRQLLKFSQHFSNSLNFSICSPKFPSTGGGVHRIGQKNSTNDKSLNVTSSEPMQQGESKVIIPQTGPDLNTPPKSQNTLFCFKFITFCVNYSSYVLNFVEFSFIVLHIDQTLHLGPVKMLVVCSLLLLIARKQHFNLRAWALYYIAKIELCLYTKFFEKTFPL